MNSEGIFPQSLKDFVKKNKTEDVSKMMVQKNSYG